MADIRSMQAVRDDAIQAHMQYKMRLWALNVAAGPSDNFTMHAEDGSLPTCDRRVPGAAVEAVVDVDALYEGPGEVDEVCERMIELEFIEEGIPTFASARAAIMAIQYACQQPGLENLRALALEDRRDQPSDPNTFTQLGASSYFRHSPAAMSSCIPGSVRG